MSAQKVDVMAMLLQMADTVDSTASPEHKAWHDEIMAARAAVAELIEAAKLVNGDHAAPHDCYATGPFTGDPILDLVRCPGCQLASALARIGSES